MQAMLVVVGGEDASRQFKLRLPAVIGRSRGTDITLGHPLISRRHCEVFESDGLLMLRDLGSLNGTFVGETRLADEPIAIEPGQRFSIGPVTFQAEYQVRPPNKDGWQPDRPTIDAPLADAHGEEPPPDDDGVSRE